MTSHSTVLLANLKIDIQMKRWLTVIDVTDFVNPPLN